MFKPGDKVKWYISDVKDSSCNNGQCTGIVVEGVRLPNLLIPSKGTIFVFYTEVCENHKKDLWCVLVDSEESFTLA